MPVIRGTSLAGFPELVTALGANPGPLLKAGGLSAEDVGNYDVFVSYRGVVNAIEAAAVATGARDFGRRLALHQGIEVLGPVGVAARTSSTVAEAFGVFETYLAAYSPALAVSITPVDGDPERSFFEYRILVDGLPAHAQVIELALGVSLQVFRLLWGPDYRPLIVHLPHERLSPRADYVTYYSCRPAFAEREAGFTLRTRDLAKDLSRDEVTHRALLKYLESDVPEGGGISEPVRHLIRHLLPTGESTLLLVAAQLNLHPKTLQRRLASEGATFADITDGVRRDAAERYLRDTDLSLGHLARELGYAEQSVLTRSCRRWFGQGPTAQRRSLREKARTDVSLS